MIGTKTAIKCDSSFEGGGDVNSHIIRCLFATVVMHQFTEFEFIQDQEIVFWTSQIHTKIFFIWRDLNENGFWCWKHQLIKRIFRMSASFNQGREELVSPNVVCIICVCLRYLHSILLFLRVLSR